MPFVTGVTEVDMNEEHDTRWQEILDARGDLDDEPAPIRPDLDDEPAPIRPVGRDGDQRQRRGSRKSAQFNEALSDLGSWSSVDQPRRRMSA
jgi:hypothetical protein